MTFTSLALDHFTGGPTDVAVFQVTGADFVQLGDVVPTATKEQAPTNATNMNRVINAWGGIYVSTGDGVYKLQTGSNAGAWSKETIDGGFTFPSPDIDGRNFGPYYGVDNNIPYLFGAYQATANQFTPWRFNLLTETPEFGTPANSATATAQHGSYKVGNSLFIPQSTTQAYVLSLATNTMTLISNTLADRPVNMTNGFDGHVFNNILYGVSRRSGGNAAPSLYKFIGSEMQRIVEMPGVSASDGSGYRPLLFDDGTDLYAIWFDSNQTNGWRMFHLPVASDGSISLGSELTNTVLPIEFRPGGGNAQNDGRWFMRIINGPNGRENAIWYGNDGNTTGPMTQYRFVDANNELVAEDLIPGGTVRYAMPHDKSGGGQREYVEGQPSVAAYSRERTAGGEIITFRAFGGQTGQIARFFVGTKGGSAPGTQMQLLGAATGGSAMRNGNQIENIDADGVTDYTIVVQATGFNDLDRIDLTIRISSS